MITLSTLFWDHYVLSNATHFISHEYFFLNFFKFLCILIAHPTHACTWHFTEAGKMNNSIYIYRVINGFIDYHFIVIPGLNIVNYHYFYFCVRSHFFVLFSCLFRLQLSLVLWSMWWTRHAASIPSHSCLICSTPAGNGLFNLLLRIYIY